MAGYSGTSLVKKLGMKDGQRVMFINEPRHFQSLVRDMPLVGKLRNNDLLDYVHVFVERRSDLEGLLPRMKESLAADGLIWVSWPKKAAKTTTDITEDVVRETALPLGLVDVKVCAIDDTWSGLKLVIRKQNRKK